MENNSIQILFGRYFDGKYLLTKISYVEILVARNNSRSI